MENKTTKEQDMERMTIVIAGRSYPLKVSTAEAQLISSIEKEINDQIRQYQLTYKDRDIRDCLSMVLLTRVLSTNKEDLSDDGSILQRLDKINSFLESTI